MAAELHRYRVTVRAATGDTQYTAVTGAGPDRARDLALRHHGRDPRLAAAESATVEDLGPVGRDARGIWAIAAGDLVDRGEF